MRILLIENDRTIANDVHAGLTQAGYRVHVAHDGVLATEQLTRQIHDLVIPDLGLPGIDSMTLLSQFRTRDRVTPVLILTARDDLLDKVNDLSVGADDYLLKPFEMLELVARVGTLLRHRGDPTEPAAHPDILVGRLRMDGVERRIFVDAALLELLPREFTMLELLMFRQDRVVSKVQLRDHLTSFGHATGEANRDMVDDTTIEVYMHCVRHKIEHSEAEIVTVHDFGYLLQARAAV